MGQKRKWRWVEALPQSTCMCFKDQKGSWDMIDEDDEQPDEPTQHMRRNSSYEVDTNTTCVNFHGESMKLQQGKSSLNCVDLHKQKVQLTEADRNILKKMDSKHHKERNYKYATMCRVRRKMRPIYKMVHDDTSILDVQYAGQAWCLLSTLTNWDFNVFTMDKLTNGRPLFHAGLRMLQDHGLIETFQLDVVKLMRCISLLEEGYHSSNPYHNAVHAVDVAQAMHCYLNEYKVSQHLTPLEKMIAIFSSLAHDVEHPGVNNAFLIATSNHLAALYNNVSVLEYHHWRTTMSMFHESGVFGHLDKETLDTIEWQMKSLILATDITRQSEFLTKFKDLLDKDDLNLELEKDRHFMLQITLKCADISNPGRPWEVSKKWSELVCDEFFKQGDYERKLGLPVSNLNDRYSTTAAKIQSGFMQFVVLPLFNEWKRFNPTELSNIMLDNIKANKAEWDAIIYETTEVHENQERAERKTIPEENEDVPELSRSPSVDISPIIDEDRIRKKEYLQISKRQRRSLPHSSDGESNKDEESDDDDDTDSLRNQSDDMLHIVQFMPRRHSLPISSLDPDRISRPDSSASYNGPSQFALRAQRRHSLPVSAIPNVGMDIFTQLSDQLDTVAECSFNEEGEHCGEKISLQSLNPGALPDANREASKLTSAHGLDERFTNLPLRKYESDPTQFADIAQCLKHQSKHNSLPTGARPAGKDAATNKITNNTWTVINIDQKKVQSLLGHPQHSVLIGRERRAVSIPTHYRLKNALFGLESSLTSRRVSMGDQPIYLDTTPLLSSPVSGEDFLYQSDD